MVLCIIKFIQFNIVVVFENVNSICIYFRNYCFSYFGFWFLVCGEKNIGNYFFEKIFISFYVKLVSQKDYCIMYKLNCKVQLLINSQYFFYGYFIFFYL